MAKEREGIPVYACERDDYSGQEPDGYASSAAQAARIVRKVLAERDGDPDSGITGDDITFDRELSAYFIGS